MKTKHFFLALLGLSALSSPLSTAHAQGTAFTYQGRLNSDASPVTGVYDLRFAVVNDDNGGVPLGGWLTNSATVVSNGLFTVTLDFGNQFPGSPRWIEVGVRTNGGGAFTTLAPRQRLTATPYAVFAGNAGVAASASSVAAANITGTIPLAQLPAAVVTNGASGVNISGMFTGSGAGLTEVNLALNSGGAFSLSGGFVLASSPGVSSSPRSVTTADVNGDGKPDLISANRIAGTLTVLTNNGSGGFVLASSPGVGSAPLSVTSADVNGDGKPDLISANYGADSLTVLTNNGSGGFVLSSSPAVGNLPASVTAADVNGDGRPDLISANPDVDSLTVLTNNGSGGFVLASSLGVGLDPVSVTSADVNGDGRPDLISANRLASTLTVLTNNGSGGFVLSSSPAVGNFPGSVTSADVNGDGRPDLISANLFDDTLTVLTNNGSGGFIVASSPGVGSFPESVTSADVNGDGKPDLISANRLASTLTVLTNNGSGSFVVASAPGVGSAPWSVTAADVNGDGKPDLISANTSANTLTVLFNTATFTGSFTGNGSGLTALNAGSLTGAVPPAALTSVPAGSLTGTIADARLSANVALRAGGNTFSDSQTFTGNNTIASPASLSFGSQTRQMINLYGADYGIGVQSDTTYFRTGGDFSWFRGGSHEDGSGDPGPDGYALMRLDRDGNLGLGISSPSYTLDAAQSQAVGRFTTVSSVNGSVLILQNIRSAPTYLGAINFDDATATPGQIGYLASGQMTFRVGGQERMNLQAGGLTVNGAVVLTSDRNAKQDFTAVDAQSVLKKVAALPLQSWSYTNRPGVKHVGPMAQDFRAAFGLGEDDKHIATVDADGVALAAIQGLNEKLEETRAENAALRREISEIKQLIGKLLLQETNP